MKYSASLINESGCIFDTDTFNSIALAKNWAKDRGGKYTLHLEKPQEKWSRAYIIKPKFK